MLATLQEVATELVDQRPRLDPAAASGALLMLDFGDSGRARGPAGTSAASTQLVPMGTAQNVTTITMDQAPGGIVQRRDREAGRHNRRRQAPRAGSLLTSIWTRLCRRIRKPTVDFFDAIDAGRVRCIHSMVAQNPSLLLRTRPGTRWTAAHIVAERGEYASLAVLFEAARAMSDAQSLSARVSCTNRAQTQDYVRKMVNALTEKSLTPLMLACKRGHPATATLLMAMGSNPCIADREGAKMAIHYACLYGHWSCTQVLLNPRWVVQCQDGLSPLSQAMITDMHGHSRYIDARTCAGLTPLHMAAWAGHAEVAKILLQHEAQLNPKIVFSSPSTSSVLPGSTPTHLAARKNRIHVVKALLAAFLERKLRAEAMNAEPEEDPRSIPDDRGNYAIMHAITRGNNSMAALLDANADLATVLVTDLNQLGQLPKLRTLAIAQLRTQLLADLDRVWVASMKEKSEEAKEDTMKSAMAMESASECGSQRSIILDGSPKSGHAPLSPFGAVPRVPSGELEEAVDGDHAQDSSLSALPDLWGMEVHGALADADDDCGELKAAGTSPGEHLSRLSGRSAAHGTCGICLDWPETVQLETCHHRLCMDCAKQLLMVGTASSCQCPFCRKYIAGFGLHRGWGPDIVIE